ncbi:MAG: hypothetical protein ACD_79C00205G0001 [uncultured bacterium]|nr:MAG: hypothetical protein ACD_79C00205G0001 [uncultured bacterium]
MSARVKLYIVPPVLIISASGKCFFTSSGILSESSASEGSLSIKASLLGLFIAVERKFIESLGFVRYFESLKTALTFEAMSNASSDH